MRIFQPQAILLTVLALSVALGDAAPAGAQNLQAKNDLGQIALFYHTFHADLLRAPKNLGEFTAYIKRDAPKLVKALENGDYVLVLLRKLSSNRVLAYEKKASKKIHVVVRGDKSITTMTTKELTKALKQDD